MENSLQNLCQLVQGELIGNKGWEITGISSLHDADQNDIVFIVSDKYLAALEQSSAGAVLIHPAQYQTWVDQSRKNDSLNFLLVENPHAAFARLAQHFYPLPAVVPGVNASASIASDATISPQAQVAAYAVIESGAQISDGAVIGAGAFIGRNVRIGENSRIFPNACIHNDSVLGRNCLIFSGAIIGGEGFGHARDNGEWIRLPQVGRVIVGDEVRVGANTTIDRGSLEDTVIEDGVKLDNNIQVGHNVHIGKNTAIAALTALGGSATVGERCAIGGLCGIAQHVSICDDVYVTGMSGVGNDIKSPGAYSSSNQVMPVMEWNKNFARFRQLDKLSRQVRKLTSMFTDSKKGTRNE